MSSKKTTKKAPRQLAELVGSTLIGTELDASGREADDRVIAIIKLADGRTWRASRSMLCKMAHLAFFKSEAWEDLRAHAHALDELSRVEDAKDDVREIVQSVKTHFSLFGGLLPEEEVLQALDPRRILNEVRVKVEAEDRQEVAEVADEEEAPQVTIVRASDLEVDL